MITGDDIHRLEEEAKEAAFMKQSMLVVVETRQFFEIVIPKSMDPKDFVQSDACKVECATKILDGTTDLYLEEVRDQYDPTTETWS